MDSLTLTAAQASQRLGVKPATLYSYVSRGWLGSLPGPDGRSRRYLAEEVEALRRQAEATRGHRAVAAGAMRWGQPVVDTALSQIGPWGPRYRGRRVRELLVWDFEQVARLLWGGEGTGWPRPEGLRWLDGPLHARLLEQLGRWARQAREPERPEALAWMFVFAVALDPERAALSLRAPTLAQGLSVALGCVHGHEALNQALILCADHELNASTFAARVVASTGASLPACVSAGVAALSGPRHGAASAALEGLLRSALESGVGAVLRRQAALPGCGHRLYPDGDPRFAMLVEAAGHRSPSDELRQLVSHVQARGLPAPNLDMGLVWLCQALELPAGSAQAVFAVGRLAGWVAHSFEQREQGGLIRPRARYLKPTS